MTAVAVNPTASPKTVPAKNCLSFAFPYLSTSPAFGLSGADKNSKKGFTRPLFTIGFSTPARKLNRFSS